MHKLRIKRIDKSVKIRYNKAQANRKRRGFFGKEKVTVGFLSFSKKQKKEFLWRNNNFL
jgi:hypothetical protein